MGRKVIYLDYAAATPMDPAVLKAMGGYFTDNFYNPSSGYLAAKAVRRNLNDARASIARGLGSKPGEIIFTAGATEANNLAIKGITRLFPDGEVLISAIEHESVRAPAGLGNCREIPVTKEGLVEHLTLKKMISPATVLVSVGMVNNEIGSCQPLKELSTVIKQERSVRKASGNKLPLYLHTDAAQAGNYFDLNTARLGVDLLSINGGKIYGPKQSGALFIKSRVKLTPLISGGGQEMGMRAGTENVPSIIGLAAALELAQERRNQESKRLSMLRKTFIKELTAQIPAALVNGSTKHTAPHIVSVTIPGTDNERLMMELDEIGIQCAIGSACHADTAAPSHVLSAIGLSSGLAQSTLRFSLGRDTTEKDLSEVVRQLSRITASNR